MSSTSVAGARAGFSGPLVKSLGDNSAMSAGASPLRSLRSLDRAGGTNYARWLEELVRRFGPGVVRRWREVPAGWDFES